MQCDGTRECSLCDISFDVPICSEKSNLRDVREIFRMASCEGGSLVDEEREVSDNVSDVSVRLRFDSLPI